MLWRIKEALLTNEFKPKLFSLLKQGISKEQVVKDILSGTIVGVVALPLAIAFAIASGVSPEKGLITAVVAGIIISVLGGSRVQIGGPTGAFIVIVYAIIQEHGINGLTIATLMAGFIMIGMGFLRLGNLLKFIPYPLIIGFTSGIALIIFSSQMNDFLGLSIGNLPADFTEKWIVIVAHLSNVNAYAVAISVATMLLVLQFRRISKIIPGSIIAIVATTLIVQYLNLPVDTIESNYGDIPSTLPIPELPEVSFAMIQALIQPAFAIAILGSIESLLSAVVSDGMIGGRHRSNMELVAQGTANICSSLFGGIPATGAIARTATNVKNGGRTPIAGITHAIVLLGIMLLVAPYAKLIPMACLAGILIVVAWHMGEWPHFFSMFKSNRNDVIIMVTTFVLTVVFDLIIAIEVGIVLAAFMFMNRMSDALAMHTAGTVSVEPAPSSDAMFEEELSNIPDGVLLYEINGPLFFGASQKFQETLLDLHQLPKVLILRMRYVPFIDATGIHRLKVITQQLKGRGTEIVLSGVSPEVKRELFKSGFYDIIDKHNIQDSISLALDRSRQLLSEFATSKGAASNGNSTTNNAPT